MPVPQDNARYFHSYVGNIVFQSKAGSVKLFYESEHNVKNWNLQKAPTNCKTCTDEEKEQKISFEKPGLL